MVRIAIPMMFLAALLAHGAGCTCSDPDPCPSELKAGEPCEILGLECIPPTAQCTGKLASSCECSDKFAGGFTWDCHKVKYCKCFCVCDGLGDGGRKRIAENTCEALGCVNDPTKACPKIAANVCWAVCLDRDSGPDAPVPDARVDVGSDAPKPDAPKPDAPKLDAPVPDAPVPDAGAE